MKYGVFEGNPTRFNDIEAWVFFDNTWHEFNPAEVRSHAGLLTESAYAAAFGKLPALPKTAFHSGE